VPAARAAGPSRSSSSARSRSAVSVGGGCSLLVQPVLGPTFSLPITDPSAESFTSELPASTPPGTVTLQAYFADGAAPTGSRNSSGVQITIVP